MKEWFLKVYVGTRKLMSDSRSEASNKLLMNYEIKCNLALKRRKDRKGILRHENAQL